MKPVFDIDKLNMDIMNIPLTEESRYGSLAEWKAYREGHRDARHAAVECVLEHNKASGCTHEFHYFGDQPERRCVHCNKVESDGTAAAGAIRDQITADANCILRLLDTVDKLVGGASGATESIQEHAQHIVQFAAKIGAQPATSGSELAPDERALVEYLMLNFSIGEANAQGHAANLRALGQQPATCQPTELTGQAAGTVCQLLTDERALPARWQDRSWAHASPEELDPEDHTPQLLAEIADWRAWGAQQAVAPADASIYATGGIEDIADELEAEALNYEGDFADTVKGCVEALREIASRAAPSPSAGDDQDAKDAARWSKEPPTGQGEYWNWDGDEDHAPMIYHVLWSGTAKKCFVSMGQYSIKSAIWCDEFGGWWLPIEQPSTRDAAMSQAKTK